MRKYSIGSIFISLLLVFSIFGLLSLSEVSAEEVISVSAKGYENTIIIEFENESEYKIKTVKVWLGGDATFKSFKTESGWGGGEYSDGKLLLFTSTNTLNPGESVKFGVTTSEKVTGINWKALDRNEQAIDTRKTPIQEISGTATSFSEEESKQVEQAKETGSELYGAKRFIPEKMTIGSDVRLVGNGFDSGENLKFYLDNTILKSINTDGQGNFLTTISVPDTHNAGTSEFIIKDESGNIQSTNVSIGEQKNRFLKSGLFEVSNIPAEITYDETLTISGNAYPQSAVLIKFENTDRILEKIRVVTADSDGKWIFEEIVDRTENIGGKYVILKNNQDKTTKSLTLRSDFAIQITTPTTRYNIGETVSVIGTVESNQDATIWIKDEDGKIVRYDVISSVDGTLNYEFNVDETFSTGTYAAIIKQGAGSDATLFGVSKYPTSNVVALMNQRNFDLNSQAVLSIVSPPTSKLSITVLDSNDNVKLTESITASPSGKNKYTIDLDGLSSGIFRAVVSTTNIQDSVKFSIGLEPGSGPISLITTKNNYSPGESIVTIGHTGSDARLTVTLRDPSGNISSQTEIFSDSTGNFSTNEIGIPTEGVLGVWEITIHSRLDSKVLEINVDIPVSKGLTLELVETDFKIGDTIMIKGSGQSDASRLQIEITNEAGEMIVLLETPITDEGKFSLPWIIPSNIDAGMYTIEVHDSENSDSFEIFIE